MENTSQKLGLPITYNQTYVDLLAVDPVSLFAYWDVAKLDSSGEKILRLYQNSKKFSDIYLSGADNWHLSASPSNTYFVELVSIENGNERVIAKSHEVHTPPESFSMDEGEEWLEITGWLRKYFSFLSQRVSFGSLFKKKDQKTEWLLKELLIKKKIGPNVSSDFLRKR